MINRMLLQDTDTLASNSFESLDRITISSAAATALGYTALDEDIFGITRSTSAWSDGAISHNSGTDRDLALALIDDRFKAVWTAGGQPKVILTG